MKIVTVPIYPPIPIRTHDWAAFLDGTEETGPIGYGSTESEALAELLELSEPEGEA